MKRGKYFYDFAKKAASELGVNYNWKIEIVPNVGHDHEQMGDAAAKLLYE